MDIQRYDGLSYLGACSFYLSSCLKKKAKRWLIRENDEKTGPALVPNRFETLHFWIKYSRLLSLSLENFPKRNPTMATQIAQLFEVALIN